MDPNGVTAADIDAALRQMRAENGGHEPYGPAVYSVAKAIAKGRRDAEAQTQAE